MSEAANIQARPWPTLKLSEIFRINRDQSLPARHPQSTFFHYSIPAWDELGGPAIELGSVIESSKTLISSPSVLVSKLNPRKPRVVAVENPGARTCCSTEFICFVPKKDTFNLRFWSAYFLSDEFSSRLAKIAVGSTNSHTRASPRETLSWLVPDVPEFEQERISEVLGTLDIAIQQTEAIIAKLRAVKQGLLHDLLTRGIDANGRLRPPQSEAPDHYKASALGWIPTDWEDVSLGTIVGRSAGLLQTGPFGSQLHAHEYVTDGVPVIMPQDIIDGALSTASIARITERKADKLVRHRVEENDVVFARRGDLSRCVAIESEQIGWLCGTGCLLGRLPAKEVDGRWLALIYQQQSLQSQVMGRAVGSTMPNLNTSILAALRIGRPSVPEQREVVERLRSATERLRGEALKLAKAKSQKAGLMDDLLTGRVRVSSLLSNEDDLSLKDVA